MSIPYGIICLGPPKVLPSWQYQGANQNQEVFPKKGAISGLRKHSENKSVSSPRLTPWIRGRLSRDGEEDLQKIVCPKAGQSLPKTGKQNEGPDMRTNIVDGRHLKAARTLAGLKQSELADLIGVPVKSVIYRERQKGRVPTSTPITMERTEAGLVSAGVAVSADPTVTVSLIPQG